MKRILLIAVALGLSGCLGSLDPLPPRNYGFIFFNTVSDGDQHITQPFGIFYRAQEMELPSLVPRDFCFEGIHDSTDTGFSRVLDHLDAGNAIRIDLSGKQTDLIPSTLSGAEVYQAPSPIMFTPGDTAVVQSAGGADVDAFSIRAKTAEPFTMQPVGLAAAGANLPLVWTAATTPGSKMIVSLRWQTQTTGGTTMELYCDLADDGSFAVPAPQLFGWREATTRQVVAIRERTVAPIPAGATLRVISNFEVAVPVAQ